jgi:integrase
MPVVELTDRFCANTKVEARVDYFDSKTRGLALRVAPTGTKTFTLHYGPVDRRQRLKLGRYPAVSLARARTLAIEALGRIVNGEDASPADPFTLGEIGEKYIAEHLASKRRGKVDAREIRKFILPHWKHRPITEITPEDVKTLIKPIARSAPAQAHLILSHVRRIWTWAINSDTNYGIIQSPAHLLSPTALVGQKRTRKRVLDDKEIGAYWRAAEKMGYPWGAWFKLCMLTGARDMAEASKAKWQEFDLKTKLWIIPSERYKAEQDHPIPLTPLAVKLIKSLPKGEPDDFVFTTTAGKRPIGDFSGAKSDLDSNMRAELGELKHFITYDVRRTVRTRLAELGVDDKIAELILGHGKRGMGRVYDQARHLPETRKALALWANHVMRIVRGTV